jgi:L,D-transpeptidase catalytic domain/Putative peptidoglycan binding domain
LPKKWVILFVFAFFMLSSFIVGVPTGSAASGGKLIIINKTTNRLAYYDNGVFKKQFKVGTGRKKSYTPEGKFKIVNKIKNRPYYKGKIPGGDPRNPLGNRWLGLNARGTWGTTYAIHGNNNPSSIGGYVSSGCIRMYDNEVEWLYSQVPTGTPVIITSSGKSFNSIASANGYKVKGGSKDPAVPVSTSGEILKKGSRGPAVQELQRKLTALGYSTKGVDGVFGLNTESAVRKYQKARKLTADGIVGPATKKALGIK